MSDVVTMAETWTVPMCVALMTVGEKQRSNQLQQHTFALVLTTAADGSGGLERDWWRSWNQR